MVNGSDRFFLQQRVGKLRKSKVHLVYPGGSAGRQAVFPPQTIKEFFQDGVQVKVLESTHGLMSKVADSAIVHVGTGDVAVHCSCPVHGILEFESPVIAGENNIGGLLMEHCGYFCPCLLLDIQFVF